MVVRIGALEAGEYLFFCNPDELSKMELFANGGLAPKLTATSMGNSGDKTTNSPCFKCRPN